MQTPVNPFKKAMAEKRAQIGLWLGLAGSYSTEICAGAGFDWLLVDGEHAPNDLQSILHQLQIIAGYPNSHAIARVPMGLGQAGQMLIKQYLDIGVQTLLVPLIDTAEQAATVVRSARYPQDDGGGGVRGMGGARGSRWGQYTHYAKEANAQVCVLVQAETRTAIDNLDAIVATDGVDGVFIGPSDLSASFGHVGDPFHPDMKKLIDDTIRRIVAGGKAAGILVTDETLGRHYLDIGATFVAVGLDNNLLARGARQLAASYRNHPAASAGPLHNY